MDQKKHIFLTTREASDYLRLSPRSLEGFRVRGGGPAFCKAGRRVLYSLDDLNAWLEASKRRSTSDTRQAA